MRKNALNVLLCLIISSIAGCGSKESVYVVAPEETPKAILKKCFTAMHKMDEEGFLVCFDATDEEREALSKLVDFGKALLEFREKFIKTYGEDKWKDFQDPEKAPEDGNATFNFITEEDLLEIDTIAIETEGSTATFSIPGEARESAAIIKRKEGWLIDATTFLPPGAEPKAFGDMMLRIGDLTRKYMKAIGHEGISPEDIDVELGRAWMKEMAGMTVSTEHRFNIDEL